MKTVIDAVNEFKGEWDYDKYIVVMGNFNDKLYFSQIPHIVDEDRHTLICSKAQFNDLVSQMETNFGRCKIGYSEHCSNESVRLQKSDKELEVMDIDWSKAPEDATHHINDLDDGSMTEFVEYSKTGQFGEAYYSMTDGGHWSTHVEKDDCFTLTPRPQPKPVFTQEMCDNSELPPVGSKAICEYQSGVELLIVAHDLFNEDGAFALVCDSTGYWGAEARRWKPLTPPIELIDGKAYQFEARGNVFHGIYEKRAVSFNVMTGQFFNTISCTNIQPLTVEVK